MATATNLPSAFTDNTTLPAATLNNLRGAFRILQVVQATNSTLSSNSTTTLADTGLSATITPQSTSSKILVMVTQTFGKTNQNINNAVRSAILRDSTNIMAFQNAALYTGTLLDGVGMSASAIILDSPATTSATTYKTQFCNFTAAASVSVNTNSATASITLFEVSA